MLFYDDALFDIKEICDAVKVRRGETEILISASPRLSISVSLLLGCYFKFLWRLGFGREVVCINIFDKAELFDNA